MKIIVAGKLENLTANGKNGVEYTNDLLGNYDALCYNDDDVAIMSANDYAWWVDVVDNLNRIEELRDICYDAGHGEEFDQTVSIITDCDLDQQTAMQLEAAEDLYKTIVEGPKKTSVFMIKTLSVHDGHRRDAYFAREFGNVHFRTEEEANRFLLACDYIPDKSATNVWNNRSSFSSSILEQAYIANKFVTVEHFKESEHLLAVLESYQAEQKKQYKSTLQEIEEMER